jgi:serine/threonine protein kinase
LEALSQTRSPNFATPRRIWLHGADVYEEMPYIKGRRLSNVALPSVGGVSGALLHTLHDQVSHALGHLHAAGVIHRDVHPDNIYLVVEVLNDEGGPVGQDHLESSDPDHQAWRADYLGRAILLPDGDYPTDLRVKFLKARDMFGPPFRVTWVLVDNTSALLEGRKGRAIAHGNYTPLEQEHGAAVAESDTYAFGATLFYAITGQELPSYTRRLKDPTHIPFPKGGSRWASFPEYLESLVSFDPGSRPRPHRKLPQDSYSPGWTGTVALDNDTFLWCDLFTPHCSLFTKQEIIAKHMHVGEALLQWAGGPQESLGPKRDDLWNHLSAWGEILGYRMPEW